MSNEIYCEDLDDLIKVATGLTARGVSFNAHTGNLTITITGY